MVNSLGRRVGTLAAFIALLWIILALSIELGGSLLRFGIEPRTLDGLWGIAFAPLLHTGVPHLACNSAALAMLGGIVMLKSERNFWSVTLLGALVGGAATWLLARYATHVGASGLVFAYFGFLVCIGIFERRFGTLLLSIAVFAAWGGMLFGILPLRMGVSWEGHLFGLAAGALAAWMLARRRRS